MDFLLGALSSLVASIIFLFAILFFLRPKIKISECIARTKDFSGQDCYMIKFINLSRYNAFDVKVELYKVVKLPTTIPGKSTVVFNNKMGAIPIPIDNISNFAKLPFRERDRYGGEYAMRIPCFADLDLILSDPNNLIQVQIIARHGLSGLSDVAVQNYAGKQAIKKGDFGFGTSLVTI